MRLRALINDDHFNPNPMMENIDFQRKQKVRSSKNEEKALTYAYWQCCTEGKKNREPRTETETENRDREPRPRPRAKKTENSETDTEIEIEIEIFSFFNIKFFSIKL